MTKTRLRRDENGSLKIKTMTKSILTFVDKTRRKCCGWTKAAFTLDFFFRKKRCIQRLLSAFWALHNSWIPCDVTVFKRRHICVRHRHITSQPMVTTHRKLKMPGICCAVGCDNSRQRKPRYTIDTVV